MKPRLFAPAPADTAAPRHRQRPCRDDGGQERQRDDLIAAAEQVLAERGLLATSVREIGAAIGLAPYAMRAQFGNREMIAEAVAGRHLDRLIDCIRICETDVEVTDPSARLDAAICDLLDMLWAFRDGQRVYVAAVSAAAPALGHTLQRRQQHLVHFYAGLIAAAVPEAAGVPGLVTATAFSLMGMASWHVLWLGDCGGLTRAEYAGLLTHMVIDGVRAAAALSPPGTVIR